LSRDPVDQDLNTDEVIESLCRRKANFWNHHVYLVKA